MKTGARVAMAIGAGYVFGRTRKMRLAMMAAAASATGILATSPREVLQRVGRRALSSAEMQEITNSVRGDLAGAVRAAAFSAATSRIEALNERLRDTDHDRPSAEESGADQAATEPEEQVESEEPPRDDDEQAAEEPRPAARRATKTRRNTTTSSRSRSSGSTRTARSSTAERAPVRRTRR